jgi:hypothetical protein
MNINQAKTLVEQRAAMLDDMPTGRHETAALVRQQAVELEQLRADAARYQWLRKRVGVSLDTTYPTVWLPGGSARIDLSDEMKTDAAIDAAMKDAK